MKIYPDCGYFNEEKYDEYSPYPGSVKIATGMRYA